MSKRHRALQKQQALEARAHSRNALRRIEYAKMAANGTPGFKELHKPQKVEDGRPVPVVTQRDIGHDYLDRYRTGTTPGMPPRGRQAPGGVDWDDWERSRGKSTYPAERPYDSGEQYLRRFRGLGGKFL